MSSNDLKGVKNSTEAILLTKIKKEKKDDGKEKKK
jgi:hypothetical protein